MNQVEVEIEQLWQQDSNDFEGLLLAALAAGRPTPVEARLLTCACIRLGWQLLDQRCRAAVRTVRSRPGPDGC